MVLAQCQWISIPGTGILSFRVGVGLWQSCALSPLLFVIFVDRTSKRVRGSRGYSQTMSFLLSSHRRPSAHPPEPLAAERFAKRSVCESAPQSLRPRFSPGKKDGTPGLKTATIYYADARYIFFLSCIGASKKKQPKEYIKFISGFSQKNVIVVLCPPTSHFQIGLS